MIWILFLLFLSVDVVRSSTECGATKASYFQDFWGNIFVHYRYESLICTYGCCGSMSERHCCSQIENHYGAVIGGSIGGCFALFLMLALSVYLCKVYNLKKMKTNPAPCEEDNDTGTLTRSSIQYNVRKESVHFGGFRNEPPPEYRPSTSSGTAPSATEFPPPYYSRNNEAY